MKFIKDNVIVILAFLLPILLIIGTALVTYIPGFFLTSQYDFVYTLCDNIRNYDYDCHDNLKRRYRVEAGRLVSSELNSTTTQVRLFYHDLKKNEGREITKAEAMGFTYNGLLTSPDGVSVGSGYNRNSDFLFFGGNSQYGYYLTKGNKQQRLNLVNGADRYYYDNNFQFIGWVIGK